MSDKKKTGGLGESIAVDYLKKTGYKIIKQNLTVGKAEIDIVSAIGDFTVFVEVKTRTTANQLHLHDLVSDKQQKQIRNAAHEYIVAEDLDTEARFDIILITIGDKQQIEIEHIDDAFRPTL